MPQRNSERLRENLAALDAWLNSPSHVGWVAAREEEVRQFNQQIAEVAGSWEEVLILRAKRENTLEITHSFEDTRQTLKEELDKVIEEETQLAAARTV